MMRASFTLLLSTTAGLLHFSINVPDTLVPVINKDAGPEPSRTRSEVRPAYWRDQRLAASVAFPSKKTSTNRPQNLNYSQVQTPTGRILDKRNVHLLGSEVIRGDEALQRMEKATGVHLGIQGDLGRDYLAMPQSGVPVRELMDALAFTYQARWYQEGNSWILARSQNEASLSGMSADQRAQRIKESYGVLFTSLQPGQWDALVRLGKLDFQQLTPAQQRAVVLSLRLQFYAPGNSLQDSPAFGSLTGSGVYITYEGQGRNAAIGISAPGSDEFYSVLIPFYDPVTGNPIWGKIPPR